MTKKSNITQESVNFMMANKIGKRDRSYVVDGSYCISLWLITLWLE